MGGSYYAPDRMCYAPGTERRGTDPLLLKRETSSTFADPYDRSGAMSWIITLAEAEADQARAQRKYELMLADSGLTDAEFRALAAYLRDSETYGYTPTDEDQENFVLSMRPQAPRNPMATDPRGYHLPALTGGAIFVAGPLEHVIPTVLSLAVDLIPIVGEVKMVLESVRGKDTITGAELPMWARLLGPLGAAAANAGKIVKVMRGAAALMRGVAQALKLKLGIRLLGPLLALVAHARMPPVEALRVLDRLAEMDAAALRVAKIEANAAREVLPLSQAQKTALHDASTVVPADQIAKMERAPKATAKDAPRPANTEALPVEAAGKQRGRVPGPRLPRDPTRLFNSSIRKARAAYQRLVNKGLKLRPLTKKQKKLLHYKYQMQVTGKQSEYVVTGADKKPLQIDGLADSVAEPGKLDLIEAKFGYVDDISDSSHLTFGNGKINQMKRLAQYAKANPDEVGRVLIVVGNLEDEAINIVGEVYLGLRERLPPDLKKLVEIVDEGLKPITKAKT